ncbi:MAG: CusA/CzcA family heavy metal efflux RND transporter, partial [Janthinobacterium sp.]
MLAKLIDFVLAQRVFVLILTAALAVFGYRALSNLPIEAFPDVQDVQVQIVTQYPGQAPEEVERNVTLPIEREMSGVPQQTQLRSVTITGLSVVTLTFADGTDDYFARQQVLEKLQNVNLPTGVQASLAPLSTAVGEIFRYFIEAPPGMDANEVRALQDWVVRPALRIVPGVADVVSFGGTVKEYQVQVDPAALQRYGVTIDQLSAALNNNSANVGGGLVRRGDEALVVRGIGIFGSIDDIGRVIVSAKGGRTVLVSDLAEVTVGNRPRSGVVAFNRENSVVEGIVQMSKGSNAAKVVADVKLSIAGLDARLPKGVHLRTIYDRTELIGHTVHTVAENLLLGAALVIAILVIFLGNWRAALIVAAVIPLSLLFAFIMLDARGIPANLISLGAVDFGIIIDSAVVIVENCVRRLAHAQQKLGRPLTLQERFQEVFAASQEARRPLLYGQLIIMVVYLPIFALTGVEGRMFTPMALTVVIALLGAMLLSITFIPAAVALFIGDKVAEKENAIMRAAKRWYAPLLDKVMRNTPVVLTGAAVAVVLSGLLATRMGSEFVPSLNEGDIAIQALRIPGTSLTQSLAMQQQLENKLMANHKEIARVFARTGTAEIASDPMPPNISDGYIMLKPRDEWPEPKKSREQLLAEIEATATSLPGNNYEFSQPIQLRFNELISGVRSDVAVKLFGDDMLVLDGTAAKIAGVLGKIPGATEVKVEQTTGLPMLTVQIDREQTARYGLNIADVQAAIATAIGGQEAGTLFQGDRRFDIVVRLPDSLRSDLEQLKRLPIALPLGAAAEGRARFIP